MLLVWHFLVLYVFYRLALHIFCVFQDFAVPIVLHGLFLSLDFFDNISFGTQVFRHDASSSILFSCRDLFGFVNGKAFSCEGIPVRVCESIVCKRQSLIKRPD